MKDRSLARMALALGLAVALAFVGSRGAQAEVIATDVDQAFLPLGLDSLVGIAVDANYIYWSDLSARIGRANLDGSGVDHDLITFPSRRQADSAVKLAVAEKAGYIYFMTVLGTIGRAKLDGTGVVDQTLIPGSGGRSRGPGPVQQGSWGLVVDAEHVYWTASDAIGRGKLDGTEVDRAFLRLPSGTNPIGVVVDDDGRIYWAGKSGIGRVSRDECGNFPLNRLVESFFPLQGRPTGIAVSGGYVYWTWSNNTPGGGSIGQALIVDGPAVNDLFITGIEPFGTPQQLVVHADYIYWTNRHGSIGRARLVDVGPQCDAGPPAPQ